MQLEPGAAISDRLRLVRPVGAGGMGSVWVAENTELGNFVAVKVLADKYATDPEALARFRREARTLARITDENIVRVFDFATLPDGLPYMVMELLEGEDLEKRITRVGRLPLTDTAVILAQASCALSRLHAEGVLHRDVKPENIFLTEWRGRIHVKLMDFGVAKDDGVQMGLTSTGATVGTPLYMSPEQMLGAKNVDHQADLWGLAVVTYQCLTGTVPFDGATYGALCVAIHKGKLAPPSSHRPELPAAVDAWFARALQRDPKARFASADEMRDTFFEACAGVLDRTRVLEMPRGSRETFVGAAITSSRQRRVRVRAGGVAAAVAALALGIGLYGGQSAIDPGAARSFASMVGGGGASAPSTRAPRDGAPAPAVRPLARVSTTLRRHSAPIDEQPRLTDPAGMNLDLTVVPLGPSP